MGKSKGGIEGFRRVGRVGGAEFEVNALVNWNSQIPFQTISSLTQAKIG